MNDLELKKLWQSAHEKAENSLVLSKQNAQDITHLKVQGLLQTIKPVKLFALLAGIVWVGIGASILSNIYLYAYAEANKFFLYSASAQLLLTCVALGIYVYQLITLHSIAVYEPILETQEKLASIKMTTLLVTRVLFLQLPCWTTFWWNDTMIQNWSIGQWFIPIAVTALFSLVAVWLFVNLRYENKDRWWFQLIFNGEEWQPLLKAMDLVAQVKAYQEAER